MTELDYTNDLDKLSEWVGRTIETVDVIRAGPMRMLEHTLGRPGELVDGDVMPPLRHFITHLTSAPASRMGRDGHPERGSFLPPVALPRRMWAGGRFTFDGDLQIGDEVTKTSTIDKVEMKEGRSGVLCFVTVKHQLAVAGTVRIGEEQDLVYREDPAPDSPKPQPKPPPTNASFSRVITPSEIMLFRYSALTFNAHRIHYDREYARSVEGYPNLVFHGPLTATLLADLAVSESGGSLASFEFRGMAPLFDDQPFTISGVRDDRVVDLWATTPGGGVAMKASATLQF